MFLVDLARADTARFSGQPIDAGSYLCQDERSIEVRVDIDTQRGHIKIYHATWKLEGPYAYFEGAITDDRHVRRYTIDRCAMQYTIESGEYYLYCGFTGTCVKN